MAIYFGATVLKVFLLCSTKFSKVYEWKKWVKFNSKISNCKLWVGFVVTALDVCLIDGSMRSPEGHAIWKFLPTKIKRFVSRLILSSSGSLSSFTRWPQNYNFQDKIKLDLCLRFIARGCLVDCTLPSINHHFHVSQKNCQVWVMVHEKKIRGNTILIIKCTFSRTHAVNHLLDVSCWWCQHRLLLYATIIIRITIVLSDITQMWPPVTLRPFRKMLSNVRQNMMP